MCWIGKVDDKRIAKQNIIVYKVLERWGIKNKEYRSPFQGKNYEMGHRYTLIKPLEVRTLGLDGSIIQGFHCYSQNAHITLGYQKKPYSKEKPTKILCVGSSRRFGNIMQTYDLYVSVWKSVVVECVIPKGTEYYINKYGEIVTPCLYFRWELGAPKNEQPMRFREVKKNWLFD